MPEVEVIVPKDCPGCDKPIKTGDRVVMRRETAAHPALVWHLDCRPLTPSNPLSPSIPSP